MSTIVGCHYVKNETVATPKIKLTQTALDAVNSDTDFDIVTSSMAKRSPASCE